VLAVETPRVLPRFGEQAHAADCGSRDGPTGPPPLDSQLTAGAAGTLIGPTLGLL